MTIAVKYSISDVTYLTSIVLRATVQQQPVTIKTEMGKLSPRFIN